MDTDDSGYFRARKPVMACGHVSNAIYTEEDGTKIDVCLECLKIKPKVAKEAVDLKNRTAECYICGKVALSSPDLFSFFYTGKTHDTYYCGCSG